MGLPLNFCKRTFKGVQNLQGLLVDRKSPITNQLTILESNRILPLYSFQIQNEFLELETGLKDRDCLNSLPASSILTGSGVANSTTYFRKFYQTQKYILVDASQSSEIRHPELCFSKTCLKVSLLSLFCQTIMGFCITKAID